MSLKQAVAGVQPSAGLINQFLELQPATYYYEPSTLLLWGMIVGSNPNLLPIYNASMGQGGTSGWAAVSNCAVAISAAQALDGYGSLAMTASASGTMKAASPIGTSGVAVTAGNQYTGMLYFRAAATVRSCSTSILWYSSSGSLLSTSTGTAVNDSTSAWTQAYVTANAPASSAYAAVESTVTSAGSSEVHYLDCASIAPGSDLVWQDGAASLWVQYTGGLITGVALTVGQQFTRRTLTYTGFALKTAV